mgnify:CR=1 FL=1
MLLRLRRLIASYIDIMLISFIIYYPFKLLEILFKNNMVLNIISAILILVIFYTLILNKDGIIGYESIGKKIMRLKIYKDGKRLEDKKILRKRNYLSFYDLPFYVINVLFDNKTEGDIKCNTEVK